MTATNMDSILRLADSVEQKNDRWLFLVTLMILGLATFFAFRWLVTRLESLVKEHREDQQQYATTLVDITADYSKISQSLISAMSRSTEVIERNTQALAELTRERSNA